MSKYLQIVIISLCISISSTASSQVSIGVKGGLGKSHFGLGAALEEWIRFYYDGFNDFIPAPFSRYGFQGGVFADFRINSIISLQPEILYSEKGAGGDKYTNDKFEFNYIETALLVKCELSKSSSNSFFILGGFENDFNISGKWTTQDVGTREVFEYEVANLKSSDFGGVLGAGIRHKINRLVLTLECRYVFGLNSLVDTDVPFTDSPEKFYFSNEDEPARNRSLKFLAGLAFQI